MSPKEPCVENPWTQCVTCLCDVSLPLRWKEVFPSCTAVLTSAEVLIASPLRRRRHALTTDSRRSLVASISAMAACVRLSMSWRCWSSWTPSFPQLCFSSTQRGHQLRQHYTPLLHSRLQIRHFRTLAMGCCGTQQADVRTVSWAVNFGHFVIVDCIGGRA